MAIWHIAGPKSLCKYIYIYMPYSSSYVLIFGPMYALYRYLGPLGWDLFGVLASGRASTERVRVNFVYQARPTGNE